MLTARRQYDIPDSETFTDIFQPVLDGDSFKIGVLADDGGRIAITPKSRREIERYLSAQAFADRAFPATILQRTDRQSVSKFRRLKAGSPQFVILETDSGRPLGDWLSYYLWLRIEPEVIEPFDAAEVYPGDKVRRLRARVAVLAIRELVHERLSTGDVKKQKSLLKKRVTDQLKLDGLRVSETQSQFPPALPVVARAEPRSLQGRRDRTLHRSLTVARLSSGASKTMRRRCGEKLRPCPIQTTSP